MRHKILLIFVLILVTSCTPSPGQSDEPGTVPPDTAVTSPVQDAPMTNGPMENPLAPQPNDVNLERGTVFIEEKGLLIRESFPPQISLVFSGNLPTPCHQLRAQVSDPDADDRINVEIYTVVDPNMMCTQVLKPFQESIDLGTFPSGHYSVWVNGESVGEFDS